DFKTACEHGFLGYPAFHIKHGSEFNNNVLEAFARRLPPRSRSDFGRYLELKGLNPDVEMTDFSLLGYVGAKLPDDGFEIVHPFDSATAPFELILEVAGFRYESEVPAAEIEKGDEITFTPEPDHKHDSGAIRIDRAGKKLGYVDRGRTQLLHSYLEKGHKVSGEVVRKNGTEQRPLIYI
ncbi:HIRAN domain-containing protein, partial [Sansalvadorimonas verongulae]|uniref:HIRAN domain-containing protein n=1 Tax=Sansalvadorimonas verongulae TaxID=2172824 RepID=UPI0012BC1498